MKRLAAVMMMAMLVSACGDSSTGVNTASRGPGDNDFIPPDSVPKGYAPDSVYTIGNVVIREYGENNPRVETLDETLLCVEEVEALVAHYQQEGYGGATTVSSAQATHPDGRCAELSIVQLPGLPGNFIELLIAYTGGRYSVVPMQVENNKVVNFEETGKAPGPEGIPWGPLSRCFFQAAAEYKQCKDECGCTNACLALASYAYLLCLVMIQL